MSDPAPRGLWPCGAPRREHLLGVLPVRGDAARRVSQSRAGDLPTRLHWASACGLHVLGAPPEASPRQRVGDHDDAAPRKGSGYHALLCPLRGRVSPCLPRSPPFQDERFRTALRTPPNGDISCFDRARCFQGVSPVRVACVLCSRSAPVLMEQVLLRFPATIVSLTVPALSCLDRL